MVYLYCIVVVLLGSFLWTTQPAPVMYLGALLVGHALALAVIAAVA